MKKLFRFRISLNQAVILAFISITVSGCGVWRDFTTYFNLYYNLSDLYSQAEAAIKDQKKNLYDLDEITISSNASALLNQVVDKASKLLQFNGESSFVDDALLMLGKSFYYMQNYQKALKKFDELITAQPNSSLALEADFWGAKTELRLRNYDKGLERLAGVKEKALKIDDGNILTLVYIEEIKYELSKKNYLAAIDGCKALIAYDYDSGISAETSFQLGKLYLIQGQNQDAAKAFENVSSYSPSFDVKFNSSIELGKVLRQLNQNEEALKAFQKLRTETKYSDKFDVVDLEIGLSYLSMGKIKQASAKLMLVDTANASSVNAGIARFYMGKILEEEYQLYDSAMYFYKKASTSTTLPEYQTKAQNKVTVFTKYTTTKELIDEQLKQFSYAKDHDLYVKDSLKYVEDTTNAGILQREQQSERKTASRGNDRGNGERRGEGNDPRQGAQPQTADNVSKIAKPSLPSVSADSLMNLIAKAKFELGNIYFAEFNRIDTAIICYKDILDNYPKSSYKAQTTFALGSCYQALNKKEMADSIFTYIYENYKTEPVVNQAAIKLNKPQIDLNFDPGKNLFLEAEKLMKKKEYVASINGFYNIYKTYPSSAFAPKALLASGWILENDLKMADSAAAVYDTICSRYPATNYANSVKGKLEYYKLDREKRRSNLGERDSLSIASDASQKQALSAASLKNEAPKDSLLANEKEKNQQLASKSAETAKPPVVKNEPEAVKKTTVTEDNTEKVNIKAITAKEKQELEMISNRIAEIEKKVSGLKTEKENLLEKNSNRKPELQEAIKMILETKENLSKLPK